MLRLIPGNTTFLCMICYGIVPSLGWLGVNSDAGVHDRVVIQELLKEVAQNQVLEASHKSFKGTPESNMDITL